MIKKPKKNSMWLTSSWTTLSRLHLSRIWDGQQEKASSQCLATTLNIAFSTSQNYNLGIVKGRKWLLSTFDHMNSLKIDLKKVAFRFFKKQKMTSKWHSTTWIITFSTSSKSHFGLVKRHKMSSQFLTTTRRIACFIHPSHIKCWSKGR